MREIEYLRHRVAVVLAALGGNSRRLQPPPASPAQPRPSAPLLAPRPGPSVMGNGSLLTGKLTNDDPNAGFRRILNQPESCSSLRMRLLSSLVYIRGSGLGEFRHGQRTGDRDAADE